MLKPIIINNLNQAGIADSPYTGIEHAVAAMVGIDVQSEPGIHKAHQKLTKITAANVPTEFCKVAVNCSNGRQYVFSSETGKIYENNAGTWTLKYTIAAKNGASIVLGAHEYSGYLYFATQNFLHRIKVSNASGTWNSSTVEKDWADLTLNQELLRKSPIVLKFDGVDDYVSIASVALSHTDVTFSCWFYVDEDTSEAEIRQIWGANDTASNMQVELGGDNSSLPNINRVAIRSGSTIVAQTDNNAFTAETWHHLVYTRSTNTHKIYIDGIERPLITTANTAFANATNTRYIGTKNTTPTSIFKGGLSELRIQSTVLTAAEVLQTYEGTLHKTTGTLAYYPLNNTQKDISGTATATLSGSPLYLYLTDFEMPYRTALQTALSENDTDRKFFTANAETVDYIKIWIADKGASDVTIRIHDSTDTLVGVSATITNANLVNGWNYFNVAATGLTLGGRYHLHVYGGTDVFLKSNNYEDLADSFIEILSNGDTEFHPMRIQNLVLFVGDRNYIHQVDINRLDGTHVFTARALDFVAPLRAKCLYRYNTDLVIGTYVDDKVTETQLLRWNTWSSSFSVSDTIPEQGINAFIDGDNFLLVSAGEAGNIYYYNGARLELVRGLPGNYSEGGKTTIHPNATANFLGIPLLGVSNVSGNPTMQGVYGFGSKNANYPSILSLDYPISERSGSDFVTSGIEIGFILVVGNDLYVSWKNGSTKGIDKLDYTAKLNGAYFDTMVLDISRILLDSYQEFVVKYVGLNSGDVEIQYNKHYANTWTDIPLDDNANMKQLRGSKHIEACPIQFRVKLTTSGNNTPKFTEAIILVN